MPDQPHPANIATIIGAVFDGPYEGAMRAGTAAEWLARYAHNRRASIAIRKARNGDDGVSFRADDGVVWHLRAEGRAS